MPLHQGGVALQTCTNFYKTNKKRVLVAGVGTLRSKLRPLLEGRGGVIMKNKCRTFRGGTGTVSFYRIIDQVNIGVSCNRYIYKSVCKVFQYLKYITRSCMVAVAVTLEQK